MIPYLPIETRQEAAKRSLELRQKRAAVKFTLARRMGSYFQRERMMWAWPLEEVQGMKVFDLLCALPGIGKARALSLLEQAGIPEKNTVRACGPRQTERLFALLG